MISQGWSGEEPAIRPEHGSPASGPRRVAVVTGTRAEFGLLAPVMRAVEAEPRLELAIVASGTHLLPPALTFREVKEAFPDRIADAVPMQTPGRRTRADDVRAVGVGIARFGRSFERLRPDWVLVLGDRIEAFAAASAASIGGYAVAHVHGGDRAEGVADEAMRHAITKLSHLHLAATETSADRLRRMGERAEDVHTVGSPAADGLAGIEPASDAAYDELGRPEIVVLFHPIGRHDEEEELSASNVLEAACAASERVLALMPNHDAGRTGVARALEAAAAPGASPRVRLLEHLPRGQFVALLKRLAGDPRGVLVGNSSSGLIEASVLGLAAVDIGPRQGGRERPGSVVHTPSDHPERIAGAIREARAMDRGRSRHPYGDGQAGARIAALLATADPRDPARLRKRCAY
ncbi:MAG: UDP-N-acetylglucosamine 2-epimerase (hydrolyzing) [Phycisphaerales bacterium]|nr:MAG: UDP-N-acetylglucosamine 2-epimerase (hydrolyzing) [Phycisphaerales bacterium]